MLRPRRLIRPSAGAEGNEFSRPQPGIRSSDTSSRLNCRVRPTEELAEPLPSIARSHHNDQRQAIADQFLLALDDIVRRYRGSAGRTGVDYLDDLRAEAITAEVAHQLSLARAGYTGTRTSSVGRPTRQSEGAAADTAS